MPGNQQQALLECDCGCDIIYPCECRVDAIHSVLGDLISGGSVCSIDPIAGSLIPGAHGNIDPADYAWLTHWCVNHTGTSFKITAFPPNCVDTDTSRILVFVKKTTNEDAPLIDNSQVGLNEWYCVVYHSDGTGPLGIFYEWSQCCINNTPTDPATSHLISVSFYGVFVGDAFYDIKWTNITSRNTYGDCGSGSGSGSESA